MTGADPMKLKEHDDKRTEDDVFTFACTVFTFPSWFDENEKNERVSFLMLTDVTSAVHAECMLLMH